MSLDGRLYESANGRFVDVKLTNPAPDRAAALEQPDRPLGVAMQRSA